MACSPFLSLLRLSRPEVPAGGGDIRIWRVTGRPRGAACHVVLLLSEVLPRKYDVSRYVPLSSCIANCLISLRAITSRQILGSWPAHPKKGSVPVTTCFCADGRAFVGLGAAPAGIRAG